MKTRSDLIVATLKLLNAIAAGQDPEAEDVEEIDAIIDGKITELNDRHVTMITNNAEFDEAYVDPLAIILANTAAPGFGQPRNPSSQVAAEQTLQALKPSTYVRGSVLPVEYF